MPIKSTSPSFDVFSQTRHPMTCFFTQNPLPLPFFVFYRVGFPPLFRKFFLKISPSREPSFSLTRPVRSSLDGGRGDIRVHDEVEIKIKTLRHLPKNHVSWRYSHRDFDFDIPTIETDPRSDLKSPLPQSHYKHHWETQILQTLSTGLFHWFKSCLSLLKLPF